MSDIYKYIHDAQYDDYTHTDYLMEVSDEAIADFKVDRLQSFYLAHPSLGDGPLTALSESRQLLDTYPSAAFIFAAIAVEVGIKKVLLMPIVFGLVHTESIASLVADLTLSYTSLDRLRNLFFLILSQ